MPKWSPLSIRVGLLVAIAAACCLGPGTSVVAQDGETEAVPEAQRICTEHLTRLGEVLLAQEKADPAAFGWGRQGLLVRAIVKGWLPPEEIGVVVCPADGLAVPPETAAHRDWYTLLNPSKPPRGYLSYAVRDLKKRPLPRPGAKSRETMALAACTHHRDGAVVLLADGSAGWVTMARLGLKDGERIRVGPKSRAKLLQPLVLAAEGPSLRNAPDRQQWLRCQGNLGALAGACMTPVIWGPGPPEHSGAALLLSFHKEGLLPTGVGALLRTGKGVEALLCEADPEVSLPVAPGDRKRWDDVDLDDPPRELCSYPARDLVRHPVDAVSPKLELLAACPHHDEVVVMLFSDMSCRVYRRDEWALPAEGTIPVGPGASPRFEVLTWKPEPRKEPEKTNDEDEDE